MNQLKVIQGGGKVTPRCSIRMDESVNIFDDFVAVGWDSKTGDATLIRYADTITLGFAYLLIADAFNESYKSLNEEERKNVDAVLKE